MSSTPQYHNRAGTAVWVQLDGGTLATALHSVAACFLLTACRPGPLQARAPADQCRGQLLWVRVGLKSTTGSGRLSIWMERKGEESSLWTQDCKEGLSSSEESSILAAEEIFQSPSKCQVPYSSSSCVLFCCFASCLYTFFEDTINPILQRGK